jgi:hypothetical protein
LVGSTSAPFEMDATAVTKRRTKKVSFRRDEPNQRSRGQLGPATETSCGCPERQPTALVQARAKIIRMQAVPCHVVVYVFTFLICVTVLALLAVLVYDAGLRPLLVGTLSKFVLIAMVLVCLIIREWIKSSAMLPIIWFQIGQKPNRFGGRTGFLKRDLSEDTVPWSSCPPRRRTGGATRRGSEEIMAPECEEEPPAATAD